MKGFVYYYSAILSVLLIIVLHERAVAFRPNLRLVPSNLVTHLYSVSTQDVKQKQYDLRKVRFHTEKTFNILFKFVVTRA